MNPQTPRNVENNLTGELQVRLERLSIWSLEI